jgi:hypothetical protein
VEKTSPNDGLNESIVISPWCFYFASSIDIYC